MTAIPAPVPAATSDGREIPASVVLRRAMAAEWSRLWSVRSTWWCLLAGAVCMTLMGVAVGTDFSGELTPVWVAGEYAIVPGQLAFHLLVVLTITNEYATGMIRSSLQWVPRRGLLLAARAIVVVGVATTAAVLLAMATDAVAWALLGSDALVVAGDVARSLTVIGLVTAVGGLVSVGIGTLLRSTAGALTSVFLLMLGLPVLLPGFDVRWLTALAERLPGYATAALLEAMEIKQLTTWTTVTVLATWTIATLAAGALSLWRRDA